MPREQIPGWDPIVQLYKDWVQTPPRHGAVVVEVGVAIGRSLSWIADWCIANDRRDIEVWAVDPWESSQTGNVRNGEQMELSPDAGGDLTLYLKVLSMYDPKALEFIRPIRAVSNRACRMFPDHSVDLAVIDGDHSYEGCLSDIQDWLPRIRPGGTIGGDDHHETDWPGVVRACRKTFGRHIRDHPVRQRVAFGAYLAQEGHMTKELVAGEEGVPTSPTTAVWASEQAWRVIHLHCDAVDAFLEYLDSDTSTGQGEKLAKAARLAKEAKASR